MIKLRHQQPSLWHRGLAEDIEGCGNLGCGGWTNYWKTSSLWTRCTKRKGNAIRRAAAVAECKRRRKFAAQLTGGRPILARSCLKAGSP